MFPEKYQIYEQLDSEHKAVMRELLRI